MKLFTHTLFFFLLIMQICFAQWYKQNSGTTKNLNKVQFVDANNGWAVGDSGTIIKTTNAGATWVQQTSGTYHNLSAVCFKNINTGWAVGGSGEYWEPDSGIVLKASFMMYALRMKTVVMLLDMERIALQNFARYSFEQQIVD